MAPVTWYSRPSARSWRCRPAPTDVLKFHAGLAGYAPTPLVELPSLAAELGVSRVFAKDESSRLGLPAFKILGASWGVYRALLRHHGLTGPVPLDHLHDACAAAPVALATATDGNHGRAVAAMARLLGLPARVHVPSGVHPDARDAIAAEGADVVDVDGGYDEAVRRAARDTSAILVQDTAWPGYEEVPGWIVEGYSTLFTEIDDQLRAAGTGCDLLAVPVGVGSLAQAAVVHHRSTTPGTSLLAVEPEAAPCVLAGLLSGRPGPVPQGETVMAGLNCPTPSTLAWPYLEAGLDAAVAVSDGAALRAMNDLVTLGLPSGPCGAASLAGVREAAARTGLSGTVVLLSTEGPEANPNARA